MNQQAVIYAAQKIRDRVDPEGKIDAHQDPNGDTVHHFLWMCDQIISGRVHGRKSHRWLGYLQCAMVFSGEEDLSLEAMKELSREASAKFPGGDKIFLVDYHRQVGDTDVIMATTDEDVAEDYVQRRRKETNTSNYTVATFEDGKECQP